MGCRPDLGQKSDLQVISPLKTFKIDLIGQMEKRYSENWSGWVLYDKISYKCLTFWKKWGAASILAPSVILRFQQKIAETTQKFLESQKNYFL